MDNFPAALIIASREAVCRDNNVLYRLVRPLADGSGVESYNRMVNVVPHRRTYCFDRKQEIDTFRHEILRRPLVLQPVLHFGRGIGHHCAACYDDEPWLVMVNQTHPKILSRLQMGLDAAKTAIERGQSVEIKFQFGKVIQRVYREHLAQKERGEAADRGNSLNECMTAFRYAEWEHADLIIRHHGYAAKLNRSTMYELKSMNMKWKFEDIGMHEMTWSQIGDQPFTKPHLAPITEDEIRVLLPAWTINSVSPLEEMGDSIPHDNYSYDQAGRLYQSFRKKRRQRHAPLNAPPPEYKEAVGTGKPAPDDAYSGELEGAVGYDPSIQQALADNHDIIVEHDFNSYGDSIPDSRSRRRYQDFDSPHDDPGYDYPYEATAPPEHHYYVKRHSGPAQEDRHRPTSGNYTSHVPSRGPKTPQSPQKKSFQPVPYPDKYGHIDANVEIKSPTSKTTGQKHHHNNIRGAEPNPYDFPDPSYTDYHDYGLPLKKQDSDRSSRSTNADSGYCPDNDGQRSRGDSYDLNDQSYASRLKQEKYGPDSVPLKSLMEPHEGIENPAFNHQDRHDTDFALQKHKEMVAKMLREQGGRQEPTKPFRSMPDHQFAQGPKSPHVRSPKEMGGPLMKGHPAHGSSSSEPVAESFI